MAWENILKMGRTKRWFKYVDELMSDKKPRSSRYIVELLGDIMSTGDKRGKYIPAANQVAQYLKSSGKYGQNSPSLHGRNEWYQYD